MYKIQSVSRINKELLVKYPDAKEQIINNMLVDFAHEMLKNKCFEITDTNAKGEVNWNWMQPDEQEFRIEAFVMTPKEFKEAIETLNLIKSALPEPMKGYANHLHTLLTKQPFQVADNGQYMISVAIECRTFRTPTSFKYCTVVQTKHYNATELYTLLQGIFIMENNIIKRIEARNYECIAGFLPNDMDWINLINNKRQDIALEFAKGLIAANPEYIQGNVPVPVPEEVVRLSFEYADAFLNAL